MFSGVLKASIDRPKMKTLDVSFFLTANIARVGAGFMMRIMLLVTILALAMGFDAEAGAPPAFRVGIELPSQIPVTPAVEGALRDLGIGYVNFYVANTPEVEPPEGETAAAMMALCDRLGLSFSLACHHRNPSLDTVRAAVAAGTRFEGVLFDELEHIRLLFPQFAPVAAQDMLADASGFTSLEDAQTKTLDGYGRLKAHFDSAGAPRVTATHVWPALLHAAARAGFTPCPKICKEFYSPVSLAVGMGAAKQYGRDLWADCDMWYWHLIPGHPVEEVRSNLLLAYWLGTDLVYLEGSGYNLIPAGRQGTPFSLINQISPERYQLTPHGEMLKGFCRKYLPSHPRPWTFRDVRPIAAIIRFDDTDFGQRSWGVAGLYGSKTLVGDADTRAWLRLWNVLTWGRTGDDGLAFFKNSCAGPANDPRYHQSVAPSVATDPVAADQHRFFVPLNGVVVYDHTVGYDLLRDVPLLFVTGKYISPETLDAVRRRVDEGAVCIAWGPLMARHGSAQWQQGVLVTPSGKGRFVLTDDFAAMDAVVQYSAWRGRPDEIRYRFGDRVVVIRRVTDNDVTVEILPVG